MVSGELICPAISISRTKYSVQTDVVLLQNNCLYQELEAKRLVPPIFTENSLSFLGLLLYSWQVTLYSGPGIVETIGGFICTALIFPGSLENRAVQEKQVYKSHSRDKASRVWVFSGTTPTLPPHCSSRWQATRSCLPNTTYIRKLNTLLVEIIADF